MSGVQVLHGAFGSTFCKLFFFIEMELDLQPGDVVKVLESAALGWVRARVIRVNLEGESLFKAIKAENLQLEVIKFD